MWSLRSMRSRAGLDAVLEIQHRIWNRLFGRCWLLFNGQTARRVVPVSAPGLAQWVLMCWSARRHVRQIVFNVRRQSLLRHAGWKVLLLHSSFIVFDL
jgi:hypothetical protein